MLASDWGAGLAHYGTLKAQRRPLSGTGSVTYEVDG